MKHYTFNVVCSFTMQHTFTEPEVQSSEDGRTGDVEPTQEALSQLESELSNHMQNNFAIAEIQAFADSDALLGIMESGED